ncbi:MAG: hypothetical protein R3A52_00660 [Polyangiales bacterium]
MSLDTPPAAAFALGTAIAWVTVTALGRLLRGGPYATFLAVLLGIHSLSSVSVFRTVGPAWPVFVWLQLAVFVHFALLIRPRCEGRALPLP